MFEAYKNWLFDLLNSLKREHLEKARRDIKELAQAERNWLRDNRPKIQRTKHAFEGLDAEYEPLK